MISMAGSGNPLENAIEVTVNINDKRIAPHFKKQIDFLFCFSIHSMRLGNSQIL